MLHLNHYQGNLFFRFQLILFQLKDNYRISGAKKIACSQIHIRCRKNAIFKIFCNVSNYFKRRSKKHSELFKISNHYRVI